MASLLEQLGAEVFRTIDVGTDLQGELHQVAGEIAQLEREIQRLAPRSNNKVSKALAQLTEAKRRLKFSDDRLEALGSVGIQWLTANGLVGTTNSAVSGFVSPPEARTTRGEHVTLDKAPELSSEAASLTELGLEPGNYVLGNLNAEISTDGFESESGGKHGPRVILESRHLWVSPTEAYGVSFDNYSFLDNPDELFRFEESVHDDRDGLHLGMSRDYVQRQVDALVDEHIGEPTAQLEDSKLEALLRSLHDRFPVAFTTDDFRTALGIDRLSEEELLNWRLAEAETLRRDLKEVLGQVAMPYSLNDQELLDEGFSWVSVEGVLSEYAREREEIVWLSDAPELSDLAERVRDLGLEPDQYQLGKGTHVDLTDRFAGQGRFGSCVAIATARAFIDKRGGIDEFFDRFFEMKDDGTVGVRVGDSLINVQPTLPMWDTGMPHDAGASDWANPVASSVFGLWEKAHAIRMGGYDRLTRGMFLQEGLSALNPQRNWSKADLRAVSADSLRKWFHKNDVAYNAVLISFSKKVELLGSEDYLVSRHAYVVSDIDFEKGTVQLRNPWQNFGPLFDSRLMPTTLEVDLLDILPFIAEIVGIPFP